MIERTGKLLEKLILESGREIGVINDNNQESFDIECVSIMPDGSVGIIINKSSDFDLEEI